MSSEQQHEAFPGDVYKCKSCGCEIRILKKGKQCSFICCGERMQKAQELNPALSF